MQSGTYEGMGWDFIYAKKLFKAIKEKFGLRVSLGKDQHFTSLYPQRATRESNDTALDNSFCREQSHGFTFVMCEKV